MSVSLDFGTTQQFDRILSLLYFIIASSIVCTLFLSFICQLKPDKSLQLFAPYYILLSSLVNEIRFFGQRCALGIIPHPSTLGHLLPLTGLFFPLLQILDDLGRGGISEGTILLAMCLK